MKTLVPSRHTRTGLAARGLRVALAAALSAAVTATLAQAQTPAPAPEAAWFGKADPKLKVKTYVDPSGRFQVEIPEKNWRALSGGWSSLATFEQSKGEATIVIERYPLREPLSQSSVNDRFARLEIDDLKKMDPKTSAAEHRILEAGDRRIAALQFTRPAANAGSDQVRLYVMVQGDSLYRIMCRAAPAFWAKHEAVFAHVAATFAAAVTS